MEVFAQLTSPSNLMSSISRGKALGKSAPSINTMGKSMNISTRKGKSMAPLLKTNNQTPEELTRPKYQNSAEIPWVKRKKKIMRVELCAGNFHPDEKSSKSALCEFLFGIN